MPILQLDHRKTARDARAPHLLPKVSQSLVDSTTRLASSLSPMLRFVIGALALVTPASAVRRDLHSLHGHSQYVVWL